MYYNITARVKPEEMFSRGVKQLISCLNDNNGKKKEKDKSKMNSYPLCYIHNLL